ncbi:hypothetical protein SEA_FORZA_92 [Gordonia phage Forza]|uniref:Uncharacterized protein n=1 Tax=Gordonia phage Forza TaxID=2571247 RepID=A0A650EZG6_9CAUD|nr:hypothetical protein PP303_gp092 [Gordonia phage Forza]QEM41559.1 hypothetical protein SEA_BOOPY_92 [Gordonia phage Boopy]QGT55085.1 hypothetical protein SEA_FORZA_92 [Gordonia phage Forza]UXE04233.1 hypothetical protein SEA_BLUENGOLD_91 [Gordonia phage BlueNGold]WBF03873.1 hypothetical protein SEA_MAREELIH_90 [Gordonia phage Mareelih]
MSTIDEPDLKDNALAAQLDSAPFPEAGPTPTAHVELAEPTGEPDAFGDSSTAAPIGVVDAVIESPDLTQISNDDLPKTYEAAAKELGLNDAGNEFNNDAVTEWHKANNTNAETLDVAPNEPKKAVTGAVTPEAKTEEPAAPRRGRGRRPAAEVKPEVKPEAKIEEKKDEAKAE